jgi:hypothetical protein
VRVEKGSVQCGMKVIQWSRDLCDSDMVKGSVCAMMGRTLYAVVYARCLPGDFAFCPSFFFTWFRVKNMVHWRAQWRSYQAGPLAQSMFFLSLVFTRFSLFRFPLSSCRLLLTDSPPSLVWRSHTISSLTLSHDPRAVPALLILPMSSPRSLPPTPQFALPSCHATYCPHDPSLHHTTVCPSPPALQSYQRRRVTPSCA